MAEILQPDSNPSLPRPVTRPWLALLGLTLGVTVTNGFARFAYGLILPAMKTELDWTYAQAGWLNTANAIGYIIGAVLTLLLIGRIAPADAAKAGERLEKIYSSRLSGYRTARFRRWGATQ